MRKIAILVIALALICCGFAMAVSVCPWDEDPEGVPAPGAITGVYQVAGTLNSGSFATDIEVTRETFGNLTSASAYTSDLLGRGGVQFASSAGVAGSTITGEQAAVLGAGRVSGQSTAFLWQVTPAPTSNDEGENETLVPFCEHAISLAEFDLISSGQAGISSVISTPAPDALLTQEFALEGAGSGRSEAGYFEIEGMTSAQRVDRFDASTRINGDGIQFASMFKYLTVRGGGETAV